MTMREPTEEQLEDIRNAAIKATLDPWLKHLSETTP